MNFPSRIPVLPKSLHFPSAVSIVTAALLFACPSVAFAAPITGTVTNLTTGKPAVGDAVTLLRLQQGMQEAAHTTTDASGHYTLDIADADQMHLVRVTHDKADYFKPAPPGTQTVNVDVYNSAEKVSGVSTEAEVLRIEGGAQLLHITENFFVKNVSSPPRTQFGPRAYEIYLPKDAQKVAGAALGPGSMPVQSAPVPLGPAGDYTFVFPVRPGETRFQVSYQVPYSGSLQFPAQVAAPVDNFAIILPKSMHFAAIPAASFQPIDEDVNVQTYLSKNVSPKSKLAFRVAGTGQLPVETAANQGEQNGAQANGAQPGGAEAQNANPAAAAQSAAENNSRPGIGLGVPIDTPDPLHKYMWWIVSLVAVLLAIGAGVSMKRPNATPAAAATATASYGKRPAGAASPSPLSASLSASARKPALLETLKDELFSLETERLERRIAPEEYERQKAALEIVLQRALHRDGPKPPAQTL
ncbi:MAG: peptidase associated/transthyretin-like domain-containing protein [Acidobacteriaceae bacterium]